MTIALNQFARRVVAVPPVALDTDFRIAHAANRALVDYMRDGGIDLLLFGGNANIYHFGLALYSELAEWMADLQSDGLDVIASIGPDFGKALDQVSVLTRAGLEDAMVLPMMFPADPAGVTDGIRRIADRLGNGVIIYIKKDGTISADALAKLFDEGAVRLVKYAVERDNPARDAFLDSLIGAVGKDRIASGMGETPIHDHLGNRQLLTYTSGAVCFAPRAIAALREMYCRGELAQAAEFSRPFLNFERMRAELGGIAVLHAAVSEIVTDMGPMLPLLARLTRDQCEMLSPTLQEIARLEAVASANIELSGKMGN